MVPKMSYFGIFLARILKNYFHIWNQHPRICQKYEFLTNTLNFGIRSAFTKGPGSEVRVVDRICFVVRVPVYSIDLHWMESHVSRKKIHINCAFGLFVYLKDFSR